MQSGVKSELMHHIKDRFQEHDGRELELRGECSLGQNSLTGLVRQAPESLAGTALGMGTSLPSQMMQEKNFDDVEIGNYLKEQRIPPSMIVTPQSNMKNDERAFSMKLQKLQNEVREAKSQLFLQGKQSEQILKKQKDDYNQKLKLQ